MPCTWKALATWGLVSTSTFASTTFPSVSAITFSMIGPSVLHGPHHSAQRSTTTGTDFERSTTSVAKVASVTSIDIGGALLLFGAWSPQPTGGRSEEHTSELQSLMRISYAVFCLKKKTKTTPNTQYTQSSMLYKT